MAKAANKETAVKETTDKETVNIDLSVVTEETAVKVLSLILGENIRQSETEIIDAIRKAGKSVGVDVSKVKPGCGGEAVAEAVRILRKKYNG